METQSFLLKQLALRHIVIGSRDPIPSHSKRPSKFVDSSHHKCIKARPGLFATARAAKCYLNGQRKVTPRITTLHCCPGRCLFAVHFCESSEFVPREAQTFFFFFFNNFFFNFFYFFFFFFFFFFIFSFGASNYWSASIQTVAAAFLGVGPGPNPNGAHWKFH